MMRIRMLFVALVSMVCLGSAQLGAQSKALPDGRSFHDSGALIRVLDAIYDASFDFEGLYIITHNVEFLGEKQKCEIVSSAALVAHIKKIFQEFISYYPDEELPFDEALKDLKEIAGGSDFKRCYERQEDPRAYVEVTHYQSLSTKLWIRIEYNVQH